MSSLVQANPILAQYVPKPTKGFATFGYQQGAQNVVTQQQADTDLAKQEQELAASQAEKTSVEGQIDSTKQQIEQARQEKTRLQAEEASARQAAEAAIQAAQQVAQQVEALRQQAAAAKAAVPVEGSQEFGLAVQRRAEEINKQNAEQKARIDELYNRPEVQNIVRGLMGG